MIFPIGKENKEFEKYFIEKSYFSPISNKQIKIFNVTFEPKCRNDRQIHH